MKQKQYDIGIIGAGVGGVIAALTARRYGKSVVIFEKEELGGACFNWGCLPSQELISFAKLYKQMNLAHKDGIVNSGIEKFDWRKLKNSAFIKASMMKGYVAELLDKKGIDLVYADAMITGTHQVETVEGIYTMGKLIIATGGNYKLPGFVRKKSKKFLTPKTFYSLEKLPESITILGAGVLGVEYALMLSTFGVEVHLVEKDRKLMSYLDNDLKEDLEREIKDRGINLYLGAEGVDFDKSLTIVQGGKEEIIETEVYLSATRRKGNIDGFDKLVEQGLKISDEFIATDARCRTSLKDVYAVGDVNGRILLAHVAAKEGEVAVLDAVGFGEDMIYEFTHYNMYTFPQFASVGMTEQGALEAGFLVKISKIKLNWLGEHYAKIVSDKISEEVLGVHIYADNANDLIVEAVSLMEQGATIRDFAKLTRSHPVHSVEFADKLIRG